MWKDIGKSILKNSVIAVGTKIVADKVVPAATDLSKEAWERIKNTKSTGKKEDDSSTQEASSTTTKQAVKARVVSTQKSRVYDADFHDSQE